MSEAPTTPTTDTPAVPAADPALASTSSAAPAPAEPAVPAEPALPGDGSLLADAATKTEGDPPAGADSATASEITYSDFTLPEGLTVDDTLMSAFQEKARTVGLSQEAAQSMLDLYGSTVQAQVDAAAKQLAEQSQATWKEINTAWLSELEADPLFSGDNKKESLATIKKCLEEYAAPGLDKAMALTGMGNNPALVKTFYKMAKALTEGSPVTGGAPATGPRTAGEILYPPPN